MMCKGAIHTGVIREFVLYLFDRVWSQVVTFVNL